MKNALKIFNSWSQERQLKYLYFDAGCDHFKHREISSEYDFENDIRVDLFFLEDDKLYVEVSRDDTGILHVMALDQPSLN